MATFAWPTVLPPSPLWHGYAVSPSPGLMRTPIADGFARQRRRYEAPIAVVPVKWRMTVVQLEFFRSWVASRAAYGGALFSITLRLGEATPRAVDARFFGDPSYVPEIADRSWIVSAQLEIVDR